MLRFTLIMIMCLLYMIDSYSSYKVISLLFLLVTVAVYIVVVLTTEKKMRTFTIVLFITGMVIHLINGNRGLELFEGISQNLPLLAVLILAPLISIPLKWEGIIDPVVMSFTSKINDERKNFYGVSSFMLLMAPILNMGSLRMVHGLVENIGIQPKTLSSAYYTGFTSTIVWSPFFASVGLIIYLLDISYMSYILVGVLFAFIQVIVATLLLRPNAVALIEAKDLRKR